MQVPEEWSGGLGCGAGRFHTLVNPEKVPNLAGVLLGNVCIALYCTSDGVRRVR
jgi:hypothetical protein